MLFKVSISAKDNFNVTSYVVRMTSDSMNMITWKVHAPVSDVSALHEHISKHTGKQCFSCKEFILVACPKISFL